MTRSKLKDTCLLVDFEPRNIKNALDNKSWVEAMNEEIEQIEKKNLESCSQTKGQEYYWHKMGIQKHVE